MKKGVKKRIAARRRWPVNPKTKVEESDRIYYRPREKRKVIKNAKDEA